LHTKRIESQALEREDFPTRLERGEKARPFDEWVRDNPDTECGSSNGRGALLAHLKNFSPLKN
jgi:hypothetical protein